jgi:hypothetical protein
MLTTCLQFSLKANSAAYSTYPVLKGKGVYFFCFYFLFFLLVNAQLGLKFKPRWHPLILDRTSTNKALQPRMTTSKEIILNPAHFAFIIRPLLF